MVKNGRKSGWAGGCSLWQKRNDRDLSPRRLIPVVGVFWFEEGVSIGPGAGLERFWLRQRTRSGAKNGIRNYSVPTGSLRRT